MKTTGYKEALTQYKDLVDQKGFGDYLGDAFSKVGSQPAQGASQRMSNAVLSGVGAGISGAVADQRKEMLSPYLEQAGRITAKAAEIEAQIQQAQSYQLAVNEFGQKYTPLVAEFASAVNSNDPRATMMFKDLINKAQMIPGFENLEGDSWNPTKGFGLALNTETGEYRKITADEIVSAIAPAAQSIYGDQWFEKFMPLNAGFAKDAAYGFNMKRQEDALNLEGKRADVNLKQAHAGVYQQQANQIQNEVANPEKPYNKELASHNLAFIKEQRERYINNQALVATLNDLEGFIKEANKKGQVGSDIGSIMKRTKSKYWSGNNKEATLADMAKAAYFSRVKEAGGSNPSTTEFTTVLETVPNIDKNYEAALERLDFDREQALKQMYRYKKTEQGIRNSNYQGSPDDETIFKHDDEEFKTFSKNYEPKFVIMTGPAGTIKVPADKVELFKANNYQ
jgi:hypothetical protein